MHKKRDLFIRLEQQKHRIMYKCVSVVLITFLSFTTFCCCCIAAFHQFWSVCYYYYFSNYNSEFQCSVQFFSESTIIHFYHFYIVGYNAKLNCKRWKIDCCENRCKNADKQRADVFIFLISKIWIYYNFVTITILRFRYNFFFV